MNASEILPTANNKCFFTICRGKAIGENTVAYEKEILLAK